MENENKDKNIILTDEELKEVAGGVQNSLTTTCSTQKTQLGCMKIIICQWKDGECVRKKIS
jgi:hypothetical protein